MRTVCSVDGDGGFPKAKRERASEWDKISRRGRMSTRFERSPKFRKKIRQRARPPFQKSHSCKFKCRSSDWKRPSEIDCPPLPLSAHSNIHALDTRAAISDRDSFDSAPPPPPNWRILPCRPITYCPTARRLVKQDNKRPNSDGYNSRR